MPGNTTRIVVVAAALSLITGACGSDGGGRAAEPGPSAAPAPAPAAVSEPAAGSAAAPVTGSPLIAGAVAHVDCVDQQHLAGDHWIVVGRVRHLACHRDDANPLVFCRGGFGRHQRLD